MRTFSCITLLAAALAGSAFSPARALTVDRLLYMTGGNACTGALPTFEGALRKRPKAIVNEGDSAAFVTCSMWADDNGLYPSAAYIAVLNQSAAPVQITCTLVDGNNVYPGLGGTYPKTFTVPAGRSDYQVMWTPPSGSDRFATPTVGVSCVLPPGAGVSLFGFSREEEVGQ